MQPSTEDNVHVLPGVNRPDLAEATSVDELLASVGKEAVQDLVVVARLLDGEIAVWGSNVDGDAVLGLMMRGQSWLARGTQVQLQSDKVDA